MTSTVLSVPLLLAVQEPRFPQPEFTSGHSLPTPTYPAPLPAWEAMLDVGVLAVCLLVASWIALRLRSRKLMLILTLFCLGWFGFYRHGCICPVGSVQNVTNAACSGSVLAWPVLALMLLPLLFALFTGRTFCASVCPLGAIQELVIVRPLRLPRFVNNLAYICAVTVLALTLLLSAIGQFLTCRLDPFVHLFRWHAPLYLLCIGIGVLALGTVIARPFCRAICPYGVLLGWLSRISPGHMTITPDECVTCRLCEKRCPVDAIRPPAAALSQREGEQQATRLLRTLLLVPILLLILSLAGRQLPRWITHPDVALYRELQLAQTDSKHTPSLELTAFLQQGGDADALQQRALLVEKYLRNGGMVAGMGIALVIASGLLLQLRSPARKGYTPDPQRCVSCMRCVEACPIEQRRRRDDNMAASDANIEEVTPA